MERNSNFPDSSKHQNYQPEESGGEEGGRGDQDGEHM